MSATGSTATAETHDSGASVTDTVSATADGPSAEGLVAQASSFADARSTSFSVAANSVVAPGDTSDIEQLHATTTGYAAAQSTAIAETQIGGVMPVYPTGETGLAVADGTPDAATTAPVLADNPSIATAFAGADIEADAALGAAHSSAAAGGEGETSAFEIVLNPADVGTDDLRLGFFGGADQAGLREGSLLVSPNGQALLNTGPLSGAQLLAEFTDNTFDLGSAATFVAHGTIDLSVSLYVTTSAPGGGFSGGVLLGAEPPSPDLPAIMPDRG